MIIKKLDLPITRVRLSIGKNAPLLESIFRYILVSSERCLLSKCMLKSPTICLSVFRQGRVLFLILDLVIVKLS